SSGCGGVGAVTTAGLSRSGKVEGEGWRYGQETGSGQPALRQALQARGPELDLISGLPSGPAACEPRIQGRTHVSTRPRAAPLLKISRAPKGASTHVARTIQGDLFRRNPACAAASTP